MIPEQDLTRSIKRWLILFGLFLVSFLENGVIRCFALILDDITVEFGISAAYLGSLLGLIFGAANLFVRQLVMAAGVISTVGLTACPFAQTSSQFLASLSIYGLGVVFMAFPTNTCPKDYFPDRLSIANGVVLSGGSCGVIVMPWLFENILEDYGWKGTILILGGLISHVVAVGAILEPIGRTMGMDASKKLESEGDDVLEERDERRQCCENHMQSESVGRCDCNKENGNANNVWVSRYNRDSMGTEAKARFDDITSMADEVKHLDIVELGETSDEVALEEILEEAEMTRLNELSVESDVSHATHVSDSRGYEVPTPWKPLRRLATLFGLGIFRKHPIIILILIIGFLHGIAYNAWLLYVIPNALAKGFTIDQAVQISITGGVFNFIGRLGIGFFWSMKCIRFDLWYSILFLLSSAAFWTNFVADTFLFLMILSACYGFLMGAKVPTQWQLILNYVGGENYKKGLSPYFLVVGLSGPLTGALFGGLYDITESYDIAFGVVAAIDIAIALLNLLPFCWNRFRR